MQPELYIRLLGDFRVAVGENSVTSLNTTRLKALLAYLLLHRDAPQTRQHIAFLFWPDSSEVQAQSNLRHLIHALRRSFPRVDSYIEIENRTIRWKPTAALVLDIADFESAVVQATSLQEAGDVDEARLIAYFTRAVDAYTGDLLPGCYDEWILAPRERLREQFQMVLERLVTLTQRQGDPNAAILYAQRLLRQEPLVEENHRRLMRLHLANGDRAGVLNVYKQCARILKREFGIEPSPATNDIMQQAKAPARFAHGSPALNTPKAPREYPAPYQTPTNLPAQTTIFFGRDQELAKVTTLLRRPDVRLVTLIGMPGTGKTRLAINVAAGVTKTFPDGVYFVPLAAVDDPTDVVPAIAAALNVAEHTERSLLKSLQARIGDKRMLLVLDNFEQVLDAAQAQAELLATCPHLTLLVTSRAVLNLRGEHEFVVSPLPVPVRDLAPHPDELLRYESVALFVDRAQEVSLQFTLNAANARSISEICRRLDGLPLAIELAAARSKVLSPDAILSRLDRRLKLLVGGRLDLPDRQRALETAIAWSYNLLDETERTLFRSLSVFWGGFTVEATEAVARSSDGLNAKQNRLETLASLLNKSLLVRSEGAQEDAWEGLGEEERFGMLETLKEYAWERLVESGQDEVALRRHALYFMEFAESAMEGSNGSHQQEWMSRTDREHDNLRAALRWALERAEAEIAVRIAGGLGIFWERRGYLTEGRRWLRQALAAEPLEKSRYRATALYSAGMLALRQRDYDAAQSLLEQSRALYKEWGNKEGQSNALSALAIMTLDRDYDHAVELHMETLVLRRELGDKAGIARTLQNLGFIKMNQGAWSEAAALTQEAHALYEEIGGSQMGLAYTVYVLAMIASGQGDYGLAEARFEECLRTSRNLRNDWLTAWALQGLGNLLYNTRQYEQATHVFAEAQNMFAELGDKLGMAHTVASLGREAHRTSKYGEARLAYAQALVLGRELDNEGVIGDCLAGFAGLAAVAGEHRRAAVLFGCAQKSLQHLSTSLQREAMTLGLDIAHSALDPKEWEAAWAEGEAMRWEEALALVQSLSA